MQMGYAAANGAEGWEIERWGSVWRTGTIFRAEVLDGANMSFAKVLGYVNGRQGRNIFAGFFNRVVPIIGARFNGWTEFLSPVNGTSQPLCSPHSLTGTPT